MMTDEDWEDLHAEITAPVGTSSDLTRYRCEFVVLVNAITPSRAMHQALREEDRSGDSTPVMDVARIFDMDYGDAREYMSSWMERNSQLRTRVQRYSMEDSSSTGGVIHNNVRQRATEKARRFVLILETLRKVLVQHGMLYVSGDYYIDIGHGSHAVHSGFSRVVHDPSFRQCAVSFDELGNVSLIWNQKMFFSNDGDRIEALTSACSSNNGNYQLLMDPTSEEDAFMHSDELGYHVYEISELAIPKRSPDPGQTHIDIPMQLTHEALFLLCNELLVRRGVMNPFELMHLEGDDITGHPISLGAMFLLFKKYAHVFGHSDRRSHTGVFGRAPADDYVSMGAAVLALTFFYLEELLTYSNNNWTAPDVLVDSYARWMGHLFCRGSRVDKPVYDTLCNQYLLKGQIMASMMQSDFIGVAGDSDYLFPSRGQLMAAACTLYMAESEDNPFEWALQLRLVSMDVHKFMTMYGLLEMDNLDDRQVTRELLSIFLAVLQWHEPEFSVPEDMVTEDEEWLLGRQLTQEEVNVLGSTENDFSTAQYTEMSFSQFRQIKLRSKHRQEQIVLALFPVQSDQ